MFDSFRSSVAPARGSNQLFFAALIPAERIASTFGEASAILDSASVYTTAVTVWTFLTQVLSSDHGCVSAVIKLIAFRVSNDQSIPSSETGAYCIARDNLDEDAMHRVLCETGEAIEEDAPDEWLWLGHRVVTGVGYLTAWIDFNGDGDWSDPSEYVTQNEWVTTGAHVFSFEVPPNAIVGKVAARVRLSSQSGLAPTGIASNGEVEDYVLEIRNSHESIDITPVGGGTVSIVDFSATHIQYVEDGKVLARYPKSIWNIRTARFPGSESDDTMDLDSQTQGELFLLGNAGAGNDRVHFKKGQNLDLTKRIQDSVTNLEMIDMKNDGINLLRLDAESASAVTDGLHSLKIYADATDQIFFRGEWRVDSKIEINGEQFHQLTIGTVSVNLANGRMRQNPLKPLDVDLDGSATPLDVLSIINKLNIADLPVPNGTNYLDVDGDGMISPLDVLTLINALNDRSGPGGEGEAKETVRDAFPMAFAADFEWEWNRKKRS